MGEIDPRGIKLFIADIVFLALTWLFFSLRSLVVLILVRRVSLDDILMFASILIYTAHNTISVWGIVYASQAGQTNLFEGESIALHSWFLCEILYAPLSALIRTSIALFLLRIATVKWHRYVIYATLAIVWALSIPFFFILLFQCNPPEHFYEQVLDPEPGGTCLDHTLVPRATIGHSVISALMDFTLALLPIAILWDVKLSKRTKAGVAALLGMGLFAGIALIVRIPYIRFTPVASSDFLGQTNNAALWSILEASFGIIAGCAATLRPLASSLPSRRRSKFQHHPIRKSAGINFHHRHHDPANNNRKRHTTGGWTSYYQPPKATAKRTRATSFSTADSSSRFPGESDPDFFQVTSRDVVMQMHMRGNNHQAHGHGYPVAGGYHSGGGTSARSLRERERETDHQQQQRVFSGSGGGGGGVSSPPASGVHVQTSIEVTRDEQPQGGEMMNGGTNLASAGGRMFPLQGERVVTINGPGGQGLSGHCR